ncbi:hypothetical protein D3C75_946050 [compost metagenome]
MAYAGRDQQVIAGLQRDGFGLRFQAQHGTAAEQQHPFVPGLVVPEARRAGLAVGDDALDPAAGPLEQVVEALAAARIGQRLEQVGGHRGLRFTSPAAGGW